MAQPSNDADEQLRERLQDNPPVILKLQDGDVVLGDFVKLAKRSSSEWRDFWVAILEAVNVDGMQDPPKIPVGGFASLGLFHDSLLRRLKDVRPKRGERIAVKRLGRQRNDATGRSFIAYRAEVNRDDTTEHDWNEVAGGEDAINGVAGSGQFNDEPPF